MTEKLINPSEAGETPKKKYCFSSKEYLRSRCKTYDQRLSEHKLDINYSKPYDNEKIGSQTQYSSSCNSNCKSGKVTIIQKPNNDSILSRVRLILHLE